MSLKPDYKTSSSSEHPTGKMCGMKTTRLFALPCLLCALSFATGAPGQGSGTGKQQGLARGVGYTHLRRATPAGEPWSIHVLEVSRRQKSVVLEAVRGAGATGEMRRELPTEMARRAAASGKKVIAVVNGDYDLAAPLLGVSDGLAVSAGAITTTGRPTWPAMGVTSSGEPLIGVPQVEMVLQSRRRSWRIAALNKPLGTAYETGPYLYTREFRATVKRDRAFRAVVIGKLSRGLPLRADATLRGVVEEIIEGATEAPIPAGKLVLVEQMPKEARSGSDPAGEKGRQEGSSRNGGITTGAGARTALRAGEKVKLRVRVSMNGRTKLRHVIGGFPILVEQGRKSIVGQPSVSLALRRHPRTAVCTNEQKIILVVVDGRQPQLSVGMTLDELADLMLELGCTTAMNTDGGGSSVMAVAARAEGAGNADNAGAVGARYILPLRIVNSPSDGQERGRGNAWIVVKSK